MKIRRVKINCLDLFFQPHENLDEEIVQKYVNRIRAGKALPPVEVCFDGQDYLLKNGFHRVEAVRRCGRKTIKAEVASGTREEMIAEWQACLEGIKKANAEWIASHQRTPAK